MGTHALFQPSSSETPDRWSLPPWWRRPIQQWLILISLVFSLASCSPTGQVVEATVPNGTDSAAIEAAAAVVRARLAVIIDRDVEVVPTSEGLTIRAPDDADLALLELALASGEISMRPVLDVLIEAPVGVSGDSGPTAEAFIEDELGVFYHLGPAFLTSDDFVDGRVEAIDFSDGTRYVVDPEFTVEGDATFLATTRMLAAYPYDDPRRQLAIVVDGLVLSAPSIASDVTPDEGISADSVILTIDRGLRTEATARAIASYLRFGPLPVVLGSS